MDKTLASPENFTLRIEREIQINAPASIVFESILEQSGPGFVTPEGKSMQLKLEAWPGGRWYRDLGNNAGHFWGLVQVIKPPTLLEITGPMFMSHPVISHLQYRLTETAGSTRLALIHRAFGEIPAEFRQDIDKGWDRILNQIKNRARR